MGSAERGYAAERTSAEYLLGLALLVLGVALVLLAVVDFRRGFLFGGYWAVTPYFAFHPAQVALFAIGAAGTWIAWLKLRALEISGRAGPVGAYLRAMIVVLGLLLVVDLFTYRGVAASRAAVAGKLSAGWLDAFGVTGWLRPVALTLSYLATVWHATFLGILLAGLAAAAFSIYRPRGLSRKGLLGSLLGAACALPQPFCSCCAAVIVPSLTKLGASSYFSLAFLTGAPMLNLTTLILAALLLPGPYAVTRVAAGAFVAVLGSYVVARTAERWPATAGLGGEGRAFGIVQRYFEFMQLNRLQRLQEQPPRLPSEFVGAWLKTSLYIGMILVPTLVVGMVVTSAVVGLLPPAVGNNLLGVAAASVAGTLLMVSTWTEIPVALQLINSGLTAPAAVMLVTMPPVSVPCLLVLGGALGRWREAVLYAVFTGVLGLVVGALFLVLGL